MAQAGARTITRGLALAIGIGALAVAASNCSGDQEGEARLIGQYVTGDTLPPARYQRGGTVTVTFTSPRMVALSCATRGMNLPQGATIEACTTRQRNVIMPNPCEFPGERYARLLCHEIGHSAGWPFDHSG